MTEISATTPSDDEGTDPTSPGGRRFFEDCDILIDRPTILSFTREYTHASLSKRNFSTISACSCVRISTDSAKVKDLGFASFPVVHETATIPAVAEAVAAAATTGGSRDASGSQISAKVSNAVNSMITPAPKYPHYHHSNHHV